MDFLLMIRLRPRSTLFPYKTLFRSSGTAQSRARFPAGVSARALIAPIGHLATAPDAVFRRNIETKADLPLMGELSQETTGDVLLGPSFVRIGEACPYPLSLAYPPLSEHPS